MSDYCYSYPVFKRVEQQAGQMDRVLAHAGIAALAIIRHDGGAAWFEARTRCIECPDDRQCRAWLDGKTEGKPQAVPAFCPNKASFDAIAKQQA